jgi:serine/threonine-protein kinase HSL1 (negative regulator of Swe1 kinase)
LLIALDLLEKCQISHRDIKLENITISNGTIKLLDFGFAVISNKPIKTSCGTLMYMAPELFDRSKEFKGTPTDIWACGVVLYAISTGHFPFAAHTERQIITKVKRGIYHVPSNFPPKLLQILQKMLVVDPLRRGTAHEIL